MRAKKNRLAVVKKMSTVPTFDQITKMRDLFKEEQTEVYSEEIKKKIHEAVSKGEDEVLLYECKILDGLQLLTKII